jgi:uncharacterized ion transporter superfamily protein YfcC
MAEERLGFYALIVPILVDPGFDRMIGAVSSMLGAGIPLGDRILLRALMYVCLTAVAIWCVTRYARKIKYDPSKSLVKLPSKHAQIVAGEENPAEVTSRERIVNWIFMPASAL